MSAPQPLSGAGSPACDVGTRAFAEAALAAFFFARRACLQAGFRRLFRVVLLLILHIVNDPGQISSPKTHHTVAILPIKQYAIHDLMVDIEGAASFELSNPVAN